MLTSLGLFRWWKIQLSHPFTRPIGAAELGFYRFLLYGVILVLSFTLQGNFHLWAEIPSELWKPIPLFQYLNIPLLSQEALFATIWSWRLSLLLSAVGLGGGWIRTAAFAGGLIVFGLPHNFRKVHHSDAVVLLLLLVFALARCDRGFSIRSLVEHARSAPPRVTGSMAAWPVTVSQLLLTLILWSAGLAKWRNGGLNWIVTDSLTNTVARHHYLWVPPVNILPLLSAAPILGKVLAASTFALELFAPAVVFLRQTLRTIVGVSLVGMMLGFWLSLGVLFLHYDILLAMFLFPWRYLWFKLVKRKKMFQRYMIAYDGSCGICGRTMNVIRRLDVFRRVEIRNAVAEWNEISPRLAGVSFDNAMRDIHVVRRSDNKVFVGFDAYRALASSLPLLFPVYPLLWLPPVKSLGWRIYRNVADSRHSHGCELPRTH